MNNDLEKIQESILVEIAKNFMLIIEKEHYGLYKETLERAAKRSGTFIR